MTRSCCPHNSSRVVVVEVAVVEEEADTIKVRVFRWLSRLLLDFFRRVVCLKQCLSPLYCSNETWQVRTQFCVYHSSAVIGPKEGEEVVVGLDVIGNLSNHYRARLYTILLFAAVNNFNVLCVCGGIHK